MKTGTMRVTKKDWYGKYGGFSNSNCYRKHNGRCWEYYVTVPN